LDKKTVNDYLRELAKKGDAARFVKAAPGRFAAKV
jgi:hypothetical protein